jgi:hypothetical protein
VACEGFDDWIRRRIGRDIADLKRGAERLNDDRYASRVIAVLIPVLALIFAAAFFVAFFDLYVVAAVLIACAALASFLGRRLLNKHAPREPD